MFESDLEMRDRLSRTWKALIAKLEGSEFATSMVYETLAEVAIEGMVEVHGARSAALLLRLKLDDMEAVERDRLADLINGDRVVL